MNNSDNVAKLKKELEIKDERIELLEAALDLSIIGFTISDANGKVIKINKAQSKITGHNPSKTLGRNIADIEKEVDIHSATTQIIKTKKSVKSEHHLPTGKSYLVYGEPYFDSYNKLKYIICNLIDTTEISKMKEELEMTKKDKDELTQKIHELQEKSNTQNKLIYSSKAMQNVVDICSKIAPFNSTVLLTGESGVGKEMLADYIFEKSRRRHYPFIKINCASIPEQLLESELFGYEPGAFTSANSKGKKGLLEIADKGTLMLDEIGEMSLPLQTKILRFLQEGEIFHVGAYSPKKVDVRIIAATNRNLKDLVKEGKFREDLFYRLNVIPIYIPSLEQRKEDIPFLIRYYIKYYNEKYGLNKEISFRVVEYFMKKRLKGNVRELQNTIERILLLSEDNFIKIDEAVGIIFQGTKNKQPNEEENSLISEGDSFENKNQIEEVRSLNTQIQIFEKELLKKYVDIYKTTQKVSEILKVNQSTISRKLSKYGIKLCKKE